MSSFGEAGPSKFIHIYLPRDLRAIAQATSTSLEKVHGIKRELEVAAFSFRLAQHPHSATLRPSELSIKIGKIARSARGLLANLGINDPSFAADGPEDDDVIFQLGRSDELDAIVASAAHLGRLIDLLNAIRAANDLRRRAEKAGAAIPALTDAFTPKGHSAVDPANGWLEDALAIYTKLTGKHPGTSTSLEGEAGGPLIRFLQAASKPMVLRLTDNAWQQRVKRLLRTQK